MPRKKQRGRARRSSVAPWVILAASLSIIGFACTRTPPASHTKPSTPATAQPRAAHAAGSVTPATPVAAVPAQSPSAGATSRAAVPSLPPAPLRSHVPAPAGNEKRLALIIDDCGQWLDTERGFIALPVALTLSVLPDVPYNHTIEREAAGANKGIMLHLPMETLSGLNPGPGKVTTQMDDAAIAAMVESDLGNVELARGVNNHEGSKATADPRVMHAVMNVLARRGYFFIDSKTNGASIAEVTAQRDGVATAGRDVFIDNRADVAYTEAQLRAAARIAERDGSAIAIGHPRPTTLTAVRAMIPELRADGITFTLAANLVH